MEQYRLHEQFEMEVLDRLNSARVLRDLVFGGGTMLRLCHGLKRYSVDLDFYLVPGVGPEQLHQRLLSALGIDYTIHDDQIKRKTVLLEISSTRYLRRLKIEVNTVRDISGPTNEIAWSQYTNEQVLVATVPLERMFRFKCEALISRKEIRDAYDLEFLIRKGVHSDFLSDDRSQLIQVINGFKPQEFKVKLGSLLESDLRNYYNENGFKFLLDELAQR